LLGLAFMIGAVVVGVLLVVGAVAAIAIAARIWWAQRKIRAAAAGDTSDRSTRQVIEGDYTVVSETHANDGPLRPVSRRDAQGRPGNTAD
jgi:FtsZ-interacting cell division protein ZipA